MPATRSTREGKFAGGCGIAGMPTATGIPRLKPWEEVKTFRDRLDELRAAGATLYGVSTDLPFALRAFADRHDLNFPLVGDTERRLVDAYGVRTDFESPAVGGLARRAVFVVDPDRTVTDARGADDPTREPDYDAVVGAAVDA